MISVDHARDLKTYIGQPISALVTLRITPNELASFLDISMDRQIIHDVEASVKAIIPGNLLVTKIPYLLQNSYQVENFTQCMTAKYVSISFKSPAFVDDELSLETTILSVRSIKANTYVTQSCSLSRIIDNNTIMTCEVTDVYQ